MATKWFSTDIVTLTQVKICEVLQVSQSSTGDLGPAQINLKQLGRAFQVGQPCVGDLRVVQIEHGQLGQGCQVRQIVVGNSGVAEIN